MLKYLDSNPRFLDTYPVVYYSWIITQTLILLLGISLCPVNLFAFLGRRYIFLNNFIVLFHSLFRYFFFFFLSFLLHSFLMIFALEFLFVFSHPWCNFFIRSHCQFNIFPHLIHLRISKTLFFKNPHWKMCLLIFRERKTSIGCLQYKPQPTYVPWSGIEPKTFWYTGRCPNQLSHLASVQNDFLKIIFKSKSSLTTLFAHFLFSSLLLSLHILHNFPRCYFYWGVNVILLLCSICKSFQTNCYSPMGMAQWLSIELWGHSSVPGQGPSLGCGLDPQ